MNRAEYIIATVKFAADRDEITRTDAVRILGMVGSLLNIDSMDTDIDIDSSDAMVKLWKEVWHKWGDQKHD